MWSFVYGINFQLLYFENTAIVNGPWYRTFDFVFFKFKILVLIIFKIYSIDRFFLSWIIYELNLNYIINDFKKLDNAIKRKRYILTFE